MISIIVPIYNVEKYLEECLLSIQKQTYKDFECILVNDGSTDSSSEIAQKFVDSDQRFKLIHRENGGLSAARNTGLQYVNGEFLTFVDSDDLLHYSFLELALNHIQDVDIVEMKHYILRTWDKIVLDTEPHNISSKIYRMPLEAVKAVSTYDLNTSANMKVYKRKVLKDLNFPEGRTNEDIPVILHICKEGYVIKKLDFQGYFYRKGHDSITGSNFNEKDFDIFYIIDMIKEDYKDKKEFMPYLHRIFSGQLLYKYIMKMTPLMPESKKFIKEINQYGKTAKGKNLVLKVALVNPAVAWIIARMVITFRRITKK